MWVQEPEGRQSYKESSTPLSGATQKEKKVFLAHIMLSSAHWVMHVLTTLTALLMYLKCVENMGFKLDWTIFTATTKVVSLKSQNLLFQPIFRANLIHNLVFEVPLLPAVPPKVPQNETMTAKGKVQWVIRGRERNTVSQKKLVRRKL